MDYIKTEVPRCHQVVSVQMVLTPLIDDLWCINRDNIKEYESMQSLELFYTDHHGHKCVLNNKDRRALCKIDVKHKQTLLVKLTAELELFSKIISSPKQYKGNPINIFKFYQ